MNKISISSTEAMVAAGKHIIVGHEVPDTDNAVVRCICCCGAVGPAREGYPEMLPACVLAYIARHIGHRGFRSAEEAMESVRFSQPSAAVLRAQEESGEDAA